METKEFIVTKYNAAPKKCDIITWVTPTRQDNISFLNLSLFTRYHYIIYTNIILYSRGHINLKYYIDCMASSIIRPTNLNNGTDNVLLPAMSIFIVKFSYLIC